MYRSTNSTSSTRLGCWLLQVRGGTIWSPHGPSRSADQKDLAGRLHALFVGWNYYFSPSSTPGQSFFFEKHSLYCVSKKKALSGSTAEPHVYYTDNEEEYVSTLYKPQCPRDYNVGEIRAASMISNQMSVSCAMGCRAGTLRRLSQS
jgi:hypothetical protein